MSERLELPRGVRSVAAALIATVSLNGFVAASRLDEHRASNESMRVEATATTLNQQIGMVALALPDAAEPLPQAEVPQTTVSATTLPIETGPEPTKPAPIPKVVTTLEVEPQVVSGEAKDLGVFEATCYSETSITKSGSPAGPGSIAVDPNVIPLGTHLEVEGYGPGIAADTGSAVKGRIIDVWKASDEECIQWGRHNVHVQQI